MGRYGTVSTADCGEKGRCLDCSGLHPHAGTPVVPLEVENLRWLERSADTRWAYAAGRAVRRSACAPAP